FSLRDGGVGSRNGMDQSSSGQGQRREVWSETAAVGQKSRRSARETERLRQNLQGKALWGRYRQASVGAQCMEFLRDGDTLAVTKIDRLARSTSDLYRIVSEARRRLRRPFSASCCRDTTGQGLRWCYFSRLTMIL